jgi:regulator of sigma E protease
MAVKFVSGIANKVSLSSSQRATGDTELAAVSENVGGPVAILGVLFPSARADGLGSLVLVSALVSLTLAVMNLLPIPALDGGRWFVTMLYRVVLRKPLTKDKEERIHGTGFMILLGLLVLVTIADVGKLVR